MNDTYDSSRNFIDEEEFVDYFNCGGEFQFDYDGKSYVITPNVGPGFGICEAYKEGTETSYETAEAMLDHPIGDKRLRDILQGMIVTERTFYPFD